MGKDEGIIRDVVLRIDFFRYAVITVALPAVSLAYCFITGFFFRIDEVTDTDCNVTNYVPSVSAVTGIKPQAYIWRFCIGLHSAPRFFVGFIYFNHYTKMIPVIAQKHQGLFKFLINLNYWLYTIECVCLLAVSCVSNKENYPLHEKIFIVFMVTAISYMVLNTILFKWTRSKGMTKRELWSYKLKKIFVVVQSISTIGLLIFFYYHRFHCVPGAFSGFSVFEYVIAYVNMAYHVSGYYEFSNKFLLAGELPKESNSNGVAVVKNSRSKRRKQE